jgi:hypothetical protein
MVCELVLSVALLGCVSICGGLLELVVCTLTILSAGGPMYSTLLLLVGIVVCGAAAVLLT